MEKEQAGEHKKEDNRFTGNEWVLKSDLHELDDSFYETIEARLDSFGFDEKQTGKFVDSVREAAENAILHGNQSDPEKKVTIEWNFNQNSGHLEVAVFDEGEGFDVDELPDPTKDENLLKTGKRGVFLMRANLGPENVIIEKGKGCTRLKMNL